MIPTLERLIHLLRQELQEYGEMLALLDQQQEFVITRAADDVLQTVSAIQAQSRTIEQARDRREDCRRELTGILHQPTETDLGRLVTLLPPSYRPLVEALVQENNELLTRVRHRAHQNHLLLSRTVSLMQRFMSALMPSLNPTVYNGAGHVLAAAMPVRPLYEALG